jgi:hypothetical protein
MWWLAIGFVVVGIALAWLTYDASEYEYPFTWWLGWALAAMGVLLVVAIYNPLRGPYLIISSIIAAGFLVTFIVGPIEDEYLPSAWIAVGVLVSNVVIFVVKDVSSLDWLALLVLGGISFVGLLMGSRAREADEYFYDAWYCVSYMCAFAAILLISHSVRTPLQYVNEVAIPLHAETSAEMDENILAYPEAVKQASQCRDTIGEEFVEDGTAYLDMAQAFFPSASTHFEKADANSRQVNDYIQQTEWSEEVQAQIEGETAIAKEAVAESRAALDDLGKVCDLYRTLGEEWVRDFLWFEVDSYWPSEASDSNYKACYYGEYFTLFDAYRNLTETIVSDEAEFPVEKQETGMFGAPDSQGRNWKIFTVDDYMYLVNEGIIPPMNIASPTETDVGYYLCGESPQENKFGILGEPPVRLAKERGTIKVEQEDEDLFVGNYDYGTYCVADANGKWQEISEDVEPPADAEWCVYQPEGESTGYHYYRHYNPDNTWIYIRGPLRCHYCASSSWPSGGGTVVPHTRMAEFNQTDVSTLRRPSDIGGGPGAGK